LTPTIILRYAWVRYYNHRSFPEKKPETNQRFVKTTPKPRATKKSNGELVGPPPPPPLPLLLAEVVAAALDVVDADDISTPEPALLSIRARFGNEDEGKVGRSNLYDMQGPTLAREATRRNKGVSARPGER
jgi:hypothetical protein